jgi:preprotein translocase subunit SecA
MEQFLHLSNDRKCAEDLLKKGQFGNLLNNAVITADRRVREPRSLAQLLTAFEPSVTPLPPIHEFAFDGRPLFPLSQEEQLLLANCGRLIEQSTPFDKSLFAVKGREFATCFRQTHSLESLCSLVSVIRCGVKEIIGKTPYVVQCLSVCALLFHMISCPSDLKGRIAQVATGEGKSIILAMLALSTSLMGYFIDVITSSQTLAKRDWTTFAPLFKAFNVSSSTIADDSPEKTAFNGIILYGTNTDFEFAFLRNGLSLQKFVLTLPLDGSTEIPRRPDLAIVDESDNLFLDAACSSAIMGYTAETHYEWVFRPIYEAICHGITSVPEIRTILQNCDSGNQRSQAESLSDSEIATWIRSALDARDNHHLGRDYVVSTDQQTGHRSVEIVDAKITGRISHSSRWSNGVHEFLEVKEGIPVQNQDTAIASICHPTFFDRYSLLFGLTGTLGESAERDEIRRVYQVDSFDIPPNLPCKRIREPTRIFETIVERNQAILTSLNAHRNHRRPVLVLFATINESLDFSRLLTMNRISHLVLNDKQREEESFILDRAGKPGAVTIATNVAGRGTDIIVSSAGLEAGGLHAIIGFLPSNLRVEVQALGRAGRQGQTGSCEILFAREEEFAMSLNIEENEDVCSVYRKRTVKIEAESSMRWLRTIQQRKLFSALSKFFDVIEDLGKHMKQVERETGRGLQVLATVENVKQQWANLFTELMKQEFDETRETNEEWSRRIVSEFVRKSSAVGLVKRAWYSEVRFRRSRTRQGCPVH